MEDPCWNHGKEASYSFSFILRRICILHGRIACSAYSTFSCHSQNVLDEIDMLLTAIDNCANEPTYGSNKYLEASFFLHRLLLQVIIMMMISRIPLCRRRRIKWSANLYVRTPLLASFAVCVKLIFKINRKTFLSCVFIINEGFQLSESTGNGESLLKRYCCVNCFYLHWYIQALI